jgi:hypothetical protein
VTAPKPDIIDRAIALAIEQLERTRDDYRVAHDAAHEQRRGGRQGSGGSDMNDLSRLVAGTRPSRDKVEEIAKAVLRSCSFAQRAGTAYGEWVDLVDEGRDRTIQDADVVRSVPRSAWAENHADGQAAAVRRARRGASLPGSDYGLTA